MRFEASLLGFHRDLCLRNYNGVIQGQFPALCNILSGISSYFVGKISDSKHCVESCGGCFGRLVLDNLKVESLGDIIEIYENPSLSLPIFIPK